jgi:Concanavalin A-like lectin/glucanases superfamily
MAWFSSWTRAQQLVITVPSGTVAPLPYFPVVLTAASLPTELTDNTYGRSDGGDLAFAADLGLGNSISSIGSQIPCEVVSAVFGVTPGAEIHVQVPSIAATGTLTYIWVLYGNSGQTAQPGAGTTYGSQKVWLENGTQSYQGVWHLQGTGTPVSFADSTANGYTATNSGLTSTAGQIGTGIYTDHTSSGYAQASGLENISWASGTVTWWGNLADVYNAGVWRCPWGISGANLQATLYSDNHWYVGWNASGDQRVNAAASSVNAPTGTWVCYALQWSSSGTTFTMNGGTSIGSNSTPPVPVGAAVPFRIGFIGAGSNFVGSVDELRASSVLRSPSWIAAEYSNQFAPGTFTQTNGSPLPTTSPYTYSAAGLAISGAPGEITFPVVSPASGLAITGYPGGTTAGPAPGVAGLAISGAPGGAVFPGIISSAAGLAISGYPGTSTAGPSPGVAGLAISGAPGGAVFPGVTVLLAGQGISGYLGGVTGGAFLGPFYLPYEYTSVPIETGNTNPFGIDPEKTTIITVGLTSAD